MSYRGDAIRVLHADDDPDFAGMAASFLEREDDRITVRTAANAEDGLGILAEGEFDCIISDYEMPGTNGIEFLEAVRESHPDLPFILYTGKGSEEVASEAISAGVTDYLQKEGGTDQYTVLANRIRNAVESSRSQQALAERNRELRRYERIINGMGEAACVYDENGHFEVVNDYLADWYNTTKEDLEGKPSSLIPQLREQSDGDPYRALLEGEREQLRGEVEGEFPDHGHAVLSYQLAPLTVDGAVDGVVGVVRDITDRAQRERELARYKRAMDKAPAGITVADAGGDAELVYANRRFEELTGYSQAEARGRNCRFLQGEDTDPEPVARMREAIEHGESVTVELRNYRKEGTEFWNRVSLAPVRNDDGSVDNYVGFQQDITERRERERELERTRDLLDRTERMADVGGWEIDVDTMDVFWTENLFALLGIDADEEPPLAEALDVYHEEDRPVVEEAVERALDAGEPFDTEVRFRRPDGEVGWLRVQGTPTTRNGETVALRGAVQDITERLDRERVLREMHGIISDRHQSFEEQVQALLELGREELGTRYGTLSEIRGEDYVFEMVDADDDSIQAGDVVPVSATNCELVASREETVVLGDVERDAPGETGRSGFAEWGVSCYIGAPVFVDDGVYGTFCFYDTEPREGQFSEWEETLVDLMSRWVSYELKRREANERLKEQNERLEEFASVVSHDLRNPLGVAQGAIDLARETGDVEELARAQSAVDRMNALIEDLLTLARGKEDATDRTPVDIASLIAECWANVETRDATVVVDIEGTVRADESRLKQLIENLARNAVEHGDGVTVTVGTLDSGFYVEDDGPGIPEADREKVFEAGYSTNRDGTGFGLSIVNQICRAHGWEVNLAESAEGGARFEITGVEFVRE